MLDSENTRARLFSHNIKFSEPEKCLPHLGKDATFSFFLLLEDFPFARSEGRCTPLPTLFFAFYSKYLETTHTWKFLTLQTFLLPMPK